MSGASIATSGGDNAVFVLSLARGLAVVRAFGDGSRELTLSGVAQRSGLTRTASRRYLRTLLELGYVDLKDGNFSLSPKILELGYAYLSGVPVVALALPRMKALVEHVQESSSISVLDGDDIVYVARVPMTRIMSVEIHVGTRLPAYATSMGRVFLANCERDWLDAYLKRTSIPRHTSRTVKSSADLADALALVREQGYAVVDQELEVGLRSLAVPIWDNRMERVIAAVNVSAHASYRNEGYLIDEALPALLSAAAEIQHLVRNAAEAQLDRCRSGGILTLDQRKVPRLPTT